MVDAEEWTKLVDLSEDAIGEERSEQYKDGEEYSC